MSAAAAPPLVRLGISVRHEVAEAALAALLPLLGDAFEEAEPGAGLVEYALYGAAEELPGDGAVRAQAGAFVVAVTRTPVPAGWETRWHEHLEPVEVVAGGRRLLIRPPWAFPTTRDAAAGGDEARGGEARGGEARGGEARGGEARGGEARGPLELVIHPGETFGAGGHATTRLCLELLLESEPGGGLCDWGAGSGVLAIAAARLGWTPVTAVEHDPRARETTRTNARANGVDIDVVALALAAGDRSAAGALDTADRRDPPWAPTVCANLPFDLHLRLAAGPLPRPPHLLILSGILAAQADGIGAAYARHGLRETERRTLDGWAGLRLERT